MVLTWILALAILRGTDRLWTWIVMLWDWLIENVADLIDCYTHIQDCFGPEYSNILIAFGRVFYFLLRYVTRVVWNAHWLVRGVIFLHCLHLSILIRDVNPKRVCSYVGISVLGYYFTPHPEESYTFMIQALLRTWYLFSVNFLVILLLEAYQKLQEVKIWLLNCFGPDVDFEVILWECVLDNYIPFSPDTESGKKTKKAEAEEETKLPVLLIPISSIGKYVARRNRNWNRSRNRDPFRRQNRPYNRPAKPVRHTELSYTKIESVSIQPQLGVEEKTALHSPLRLSNINSVDISPLSPIDWEGKWEDFAPVLSLSSIITSLSIQPHPIEEEVHSPSLILSPIVTSLNIEPFAANQVRLSELRLCSSIVAVDIPPDSPIKDTVVDTELKTSYQVVADIRPKLATRKPKTRPARLQLVSSTIASTAAWGEGKQQDKTFGEPQPPSTAFVQQIGASPDDVQLPTGQTSIPESIFQTPITQRKRVYSEGNAQVLFAKHVVEQSAKRYLDENAVEETPTAKRVHLTTPDHAAESIYSSACTPRRLLVHRRLSNVLKDATPAVARARRMSENDRNLYQALWDIRDGNIITPRRAPLLRSAMDQKLRVALGDIIVGKDVPVIDNNSSVGEAIQKGSESSSSDESIPDPRADIGTRIYANAIQAHLLLGQGSGFAPESATRTKYPPAVSTVSSDDDVDMDKETWKEPRDIETASRASSSDVEMALGWPSASRCAIDTEGYGTLGIAMDIDPRPAHDLSESSHERPQLNVSTEATPTADRPILLQNLSQPDMISGSNPAVNLSDFKEEELHADTNISVSLAAGSYGNSEKLLPIDPNLKPSDTYGYKMGPLGFRMDPIYEAAIASDQYQRSLHAQIAARIEADLAAEMQGYPEGPSQTDASVVEAANPDSHSEEPLQPQVDESIEVAIAAELPDYLEEPLESQIDSNTRAAAAELPDYPEEPLQLQIDADARAAAVSHPYEYLEAQLEAQIDAEIEAAFADEFYGDLEEPLQIDPSLEVANTSGYQEEQPPHIAEEHCEPNTNIGSWFAAGVSGTPRDMLQLDARADVEATDQPVPQVVADNSLPKWDTESEPQSETSSRSDLNVAAMSEDRVGSLKATEENAVETGMTGQEAEDFERDALDIFESLASSDDSLESGDEAPRWDKHLDDEGDVLFLNPLAGLQKRDANVTAKVTTNSPNIVSETLNIGVEPSKDEYMEPRINTDEEIAARPKLIARLNHGSTPLIFEEDIFHLTMDLPVEESENWPTHSGAQLTSILAQACETQDVADATEGAEAAEVGKKED
ncbi:hypothetical protein BGZ63DRAFT_419090 [Mariannaea sp. PMI_226]|nr:hypothetical protein BGZ63DRAFT_419090 [Mariannaea sp. PMI_226]